MSPRPASAIAQKPPVRRDRDRRSGRGRGRPKLARSAGEAPGPSASSREDRAITASIAENSAASGSSSEEGRGGSFEPVVCSSSCRASWRSCPRSASRPWAKKAPGGELAMRRRARSTVWARVNSWVGARRSISESSGRRSSRWTSSPASQRLGAGVGKMRAGAKTVADRAFAQPLVEAGEGVLGFGDRDEEFGPIQRCGASLGCFANH